MKTSERKRNSAGLVKLALLLLGVATTLVFLDRRSDASWSRSNAIKLTESDQQTDTNAQRMLEDGKQTFRFDTFGDEVFWSDALQLHQAIAGANLGGVGPGVSPNTALAVGLKVDSDALPNSLSSQLKHGRVNLDDPATTLALLKLNAVVGLKGTLNTDGSLKSIGITCAFCHWSLVSRLDRDVIGKHHDINRFENFASHIAARVPIKNRFHGSVLLTPAVRGHTNAMSYWNRYIGGNRAWIILRRP